MRDKKQQAPEAPTREGTGTGDPAAAPEGELLWTLLNATSDAAFLIKPSGTIVVANDNTARIFETSPDKLKGHRIYDIIPRRLLRLSSDKLGEAMTTGLTVNFEINLRDRYYDNEVHPIRNALGEVHLLAIYINDITERKRVEATLEQTREKYRKIFENATEGIFQTSADGRFLSANPSLARIHGYDSPEELMATITDISHQLYVNPADRLRLIRDLKTKGFTENFEVSMHRKDGSIHWISINARTIYDDQGKVLYYEGTMQDITKRKMAEEALGESEERYRTAIEHSNDAVAIIEGDKNQFVNKRFLEMFEFESADEIIGRSISTIVHPGDRDMVVEMNRKRQKGEEVPSCYEFKGITNKGRILFVEVSATTITYRGKNFYLVLLRDITERKQAEEALRTERNRFQTLSENAPFGISLIGKDGVFTYINPKFTELFGYDLNDFPNGRGWFRKAYPDRGYRREVINAWISDLRNTRVGQKMPRTFVVTCKDGSEKTINFIPVRLPTGEHIITYEDITDRIKAQESLLKSHQELERLNRAKTKAVNHISHELRTPLAVIQGNMRVLRNKINNANLTDTFSGILDTMERHLKRLFRISKETDEIFLVSQELEAAIVLDELDRLWQRIENFPAIPPDIRLHWDALRGWLNKFLSGSEQSFQSVDIYPFVTAVVEKARSRAAHRDLHIDVEGEHDLFVFTDPYILTEVLASLIKNAIENTPDGGRIQIALEPKGDKIWIHVTDHGIGITEENRQYIFDGLFHTRATELYASKNPYDFGAGGKGFELLLIKAYAQRFGFEITMTSNRCAYIPTDQDACPGKIEDCPHCRSVQDCLRSGGSTFSVGLPAGNNISASIH